MLGTPKLLIAEDDRFLSSLLKARLEKDQFEVKIASDGEEVLEILKAFKPDIIVLDLIMPRLSGFEVLEALSVDPQYSSIPVIVLSNLSQESDMERAKQLGVAEYFIKARTSIDDLVKAVKNLGVKV
ncbi:MAG: response regulator [Candidatus Liptonbacteria bacterium]|nr:response regulator [Candidatus Liptonbacteria bacterium]